MFDTYLFVDAAYLRTNYLKRIRDWFDNDGEIDYYRVYTSQDLLSGRMFYYDCLDDKQHAGESHEAFQSRLEKQKSLLGKIKAISGTHIRLGSLTGAKKNKRQKRVDIRLAVDMMNHAARQNIKTARLLSGDLDFEPVVRALVEMGVFVHVIGDKRTTARKLIAAADYFRPITFRDYHDWSSDELKLKFPIPPPPDSGDPEARARLLKEGSIAGKPCRLYELDQKFVINFEFENQRKSISFSDLGRLKLFCQLEYGPVMLD